MKARRWLAALLAGTMVLGSVASVSAETLSGTSWWEDYQVGEHTAVTGDGSWSYTIHADELVDGYGAFVVEMFDNADDDGNVTDDSRYLTTTSDRDSWTANDPAGNLDTASDGSSGVPDAGDLVVEITREGQNFRVEYYTFTDETAVNLNYIVTFTDSDFGETVYWRVMAQVGTFTFSDLTAGHPVTDNDSITINDPTGSPLPVSGQDGDLYWSIDESGLLTISGDGDYVQYNACYNEEEDYYYDDTYADWRDYSGYITSAYVDVTGITSMEAMFEGCGVLRTVTFSENTDTSHVTTMAAMFQFCDALNSVDFTYVDTSSVTHMGAMFNQCCQLPSVDVSGFDTSNVTYMGQMFAYCQSLTSIDVSNFDTSNVTGLWQMFLCCSNLTSLDLSNFDTSNVINMEFLVSECYKLDELIVPAGFGENYADIFVEDGDLSEGCGAVVNLPSTEYFHWIASDGDGEVVTTVSLGKDTAVTYTRIREDISGQSGDLSWVIDGDGVLTITGEGDYELITVDNSGEEYEALNWWNYREYITSAVVNVSGITSMRNMFAGCYNMVSVDLSNMDASKVTTMNHTFDGCNSLASLDVSGLDTSSLEDMNGMFRYCSSLTSIDFSSLDTSNVYDTGELFQDCTSLATITVGAYFASNCGGAEIPYVYGCEWVTEEGDAAVRIGSDDTVRTYTRTGEPKDTMSGCEWWVDYSVSTDGPISGDGTWTYLFTIMSGYGNTAGFVVELSDADDNYYIDTSSLGDAWTFNGLDNGNSIYDFAISGSPCDYHEVWWMSDQVQYAVEIVRNGSEFTMNYYEICDGQATCFMCFDMTDTEGLFSGDLTARFMAHMGYYGVEFVDSSVSDMGYSVVNYYKMTDSVIGTAGDLNWVLGTDGTLIISGSGNYVTFNEEYGNVEDTYASWRDYSSLIKKVIVNVTDISFIDSMFAGLYNMTEIDLSGLDTSNVESMTNVFNGCSSLETIDVSGLDTSKSYSMEGMFAYCTSLKSIDLSSWETSGLHWIDHMFDGCSSLTELDLRSLNVSDEVDAEGIIYGCDSLTLLKVPASFGYWKTGSSEETGSGVATGSAKTEDENEETVVIVDGLASSASTWTAIGLPSVDGYYWANANAETVTEIDPNLDSEMWYFRYADGETAEKNYMGVAQDISKATITLSTTTYTYDGKAKTPAVSSVVYDGETLAEGTDYTISYSNNTNAGTAMVIITGIGDFEGSTATATFTISKASQTVTASAASSSITYGKTTTITASTTGDGAISYSSSDTSVATVSSSGKVTAKGAGTATITVTAAATNNYSKATKTVKITVTRASQTLSVSSSSLTLEVGKTSTPTVSGAKTTLSYKSSDTSVATVSSSGKITAKKVGTVTITVTAAQTSAYSKATKTITVKVKPASTTVTSVTNTTSGVKITWDKVTGATGYYVYRSTSKNGTYTQIAKITSGSTVTYTNKSSGTNKVTSGKTYYYKVSAYASTGTATKSSAKGVKYLTAGKISSLTNTSSGITVKWSKVSGASGYYVYRKTSSGSYQKVTTIKSASTVSYTDTGVKSKNGTTYTYKVVPYSGSYTGSFTAVKTVRMTAVSISSLKNSSSKKMTVKWSKNSKSSGYEIQYSTSKSFSSTKKVTVSGASSSSRVIGSLTKNKTYYVRIRTYKTVSGTKYYSAWSSTKSVKISK